MTRSEYHTLAPTYDRHEARRQALVDAIPSRVNRAGRYYRKLIKEIYENNKILH
jgi:esterase/lipase